MCEHIFVLCSILTLHCCRNRYMCPFMLSMSDKKYLRISPSMCIVQEHNTYWFWFYSWRGKKTFSMYLRSCSIQSIIHCRLSTTTIRYLISLCPARHGRNFELEFLNFISGRSIPSISCEVALRWMLDTSLIINQRWIRKWRGAARQ